MTNYENIKQMTVEEMAKYYSQHFIKCYEMLNEDNRILLQNRIKKWLESEVEENED